MVLTALQSRVGNKFEDDDGGVLPLHSATLVD
jgi:hypothetical protein